MASPMYRQIAEDLRQKIESGQIESGTQLPTEIELRDQYGASRNTVRDAIKWLITRGLVETRPGQGMFVPKKIDPYVTTLTTETRRALGQAVLAGQGDSYTHEVTANKRIPSASPPQVEIQRATGALAAQLRVPEDTPVISRHQKRLIDGTPFSLQTSFYPRSLADQGAVMLAFPDDIDGGAVQYLEKLLGRKQIGYSDWIIVRAPSASETVFFNLPQDGRIGVFEVSRTAFDEKGTPMRVTVTVFPTDRNQFIVNVGNVPAPLTQPEQGRDEK